MRYLVPPANSGSAAGSPPSGSCPENLQKEAPRKFPNQMPKTTSLAPFHAKEQQLVSEIPPDVWAPHPIFRAEPIYASEETNFSLLNLQFRSFGHYPQLTTIDEGWSIDRLPQFPLHHDGPTICPYNARLSHHSWSRPPDTLRYMMQDKYVMKANISPCWLLISQVGSAFSWMRVLY